MNKNKQSKKSPLFMADMLLKKSYSSNEITQTLDIKLSTFFKNLLMLKKAGFRIEKHNKQYKIEAFNKTISFSSRNITILAHILALSNIMFPKNITKSTFSLCKKFFYLSSKENYETFIERYNMFKKILSKNDQVEKIELFQKYLEKDINLEVTLKDMKEYYLKPVKYCWGVNKVIFVFEDIKNKEIKELSSDEVVKMKAKKDLFLIDDSRKTIFELTGRLAKTYLLKEEEVLLEFGRDRILIANYSTDKQKLFKRLLKYDVLCKVKFPAQDRKAFLKIIEKSLDNINKIQDNNK